MSSTARLMTIAAAMALTLTVTTPAVAETPAAEATIGGDVCCFTNPSYSGVCEVTTGPDETCSDVLAYLNNQGTVDKTYCDNTTVRGGWAQDECEGSSSVCTQPTSTEPAPTDVIQTGATS